MESKQRTDRGRGGRNRDRTIQENERAGASGPARERRGTVRVGTASWTDPGFIADWYPPGLPAGERLPWYAKHFNFVEVNSTFYSVPSESTTARWCGQTPDGFVFDVKLHQFLSRHSTPVRFLPRDLRPLARVRGVRAELTPALEAAVAERFLAGVRPLSNAGKLGALLLQLSPSFRPREFDLSELDSLIEMVRGHRLAVELRHREWLTERRDETVEYFRRRRFALVAVDVPRSDHFTVLPPVNVVTDPRLAYLRAHGRNAHGYISGRTVADRFDYDYSNKELREIAERVEAFAKVVGDTHVIFNNNKSDYAPRAAERFRRVLDRAGGPVVADVR
jgi:uncharacterized protein YecE (DUF72 family)